MISAIPTDTCYGLACNIYNKEAYYKIFELKNRPGNKLLSIAVITYNDLKLISLLSSSQINFLINYPHPFTILTKVNENFEFPIFLDKLQYSELGIRVASTFLDKDVISSLEFPIFLTSANNSGDSEIYDSSEIDAFFGNRIDKILPGKIKPNPPSNIFRFIGDTLELDYIRKNY
ncbi:MAG: Sua5/YciO/YrdC/YwlC family protein [Candidatus Gracilibacteria bacterium]|nr:Sua5/YciO/YrdC/YwlC family protein [Candidatus Gracilibacteria bacterium]MDD2908318.1 Sua5/YciO/YrdC/YwlC family protein [Candidatus Gracilibacteria bacterium]